MKRSELAPIVLTTVIVAAGVPLADRLIVPVIAPIFRPAPALTAPQSEKLTDVKSSEKQVFPAQSMNLETLIREQNENGLKKKTGMEIELKLEKEVSIQLFPVQEGYIPVHGTFIDKEGKPPVTFGMALDPKSPFAEYLKKDPILLAETKIKMQIISSPNTYLVEDIIPPPPKKA